MRLSVGVEDQRLYLITILYIQGLNSVGTIMSARQPMHWLRLNRADGDHFKIVFINISVFWSHSWRWQECSNSLIILSRAWTHWVGVLKNRLTSHLCETIKYSQLVSLHISHLFRYNNQFVGLLVTSLSKSGWITGWYGIPPNHRYRS